MSLQLLSLVLSLLLQFTYASCVLGLAIYGGQSFWLTWQRWRQGRLQDVSEPCTASARTSNPAGVTPPATWPTVTVQLPIYNERHVVTRLIDACARQDYPRDRLQIQVLDDSTDETTGIAARRARHWQALGVDVQVHHRQDRTGYKAGALKNALPEAEGHFIAIFDADFKPPPDFLRRAVPILLQPGNEQLAFVQGRWGHLNAGYSALTRAQALALDGHFVVEQAGRQHAGYPFGFNGSAGVWRRACIEDANVGGWHSDTLCEDLDLSYRAQLAGWTPCYVDNLVAPAEVPPQLLAFKRQQFRWAKGSVQTLKKLGGTVMCSGWSLQSRIAALCHLGNYLIHPLLLLMLLITLPLMLLDVNPFWPLAYFSLVSVGPPLLYATAQFQLDRDRWLSRYIYLPLLMLLGTGLCYSNSRAVWEALSNRHTPFLRTPKFHVAARGERWQRSRYVLALDSGIWGEALLGLYALTSAVVAVRLDNLWTAPFLLIYAGGFALMVLLGLTQGSGKAQGASRRASTGMTSKTWNHHRQRSGDSKSAQFGSRRIILSKANAVSTMERR